MLLHQGGGRWSELNHLQIVDLINLIATTKFFRGLGLFGEILLGRMCDDFLGIHLGSIFHSFDLSFLRLLLNVLEFLCLKSTDLQTHGEPARGLHPDGLFHGSEKTRRL